MGWKFSDLALFSKRAEDCNPDPQKEKSASQVPPSESFASEFQGNAEKDILSKAWDNLTRATRSSSSGPLPESSDPRLQTLENFLKKGTYVVKVKKGIRKKDLFRFLLAKMLYEKEDGLHLDEFLVLWELYLQMLDLTVKDPSFNEKYASFFKDSYIFFKILGDQQEFPIRLEENENAQYLERIVEVLEPMLPTRSAYFGLKGQKDLRSGFLISFASEVLSRKIPEGRRIGVGYRDKGSRRDPALDGSPDWREVAMSQQELRIREVENFLGMVREHPSFDWDLVYNSKQLIGDTNEEDFLPLPEL